jgi:hypothetical protein
VATACASATNAIGASPITPNQLTMASNRRSRARASMDLPDAQRTGLSFDALAR